jgi:hypothetical protein
VAQLSVTAAVDVSRGPAHDPQQWGLSSGAQVKIKLRVFLHGAKKIPLLLVFSNMLTMKTIVQFFSGSTVLACFSLPKVFQNKIPLF